MTLSTISYSVTLDFYHEIKIFHPGNAADRRSFVMIYPEAE